VTYAELVFLSYCRKSWQAAAERVGEWLRNSSTLMRVAEKGQQFVRLRGTIGLFPFSTSVTFVLRFGERGVEFEGWVGDRAKHSIKLGGWNLGLPRSVAWAEYQSLVRALKSDGPNQSSFLEP